MQNYKIVTLTLKTIKKKKKLTTIQMVLQLHTGNDFDVLLVIA